MTNLFKLPLAAAALAVTLPLAAPAAAGKDILVTSPTAMAQWQADVTRDLDHKLLLAERYTRGRPTSGIVQIRFTLDEDGKPTNLETVYDSAGTAARRSASWAVRRLRDLDQAPVMNASGVRFQANIIFAENREQKTVLAAQLDRMERVRLASAGSERAVVALGS